MRAVCWACVIVTIGLIAACGQQPGPTDAVHTYVRAMLDRDVEGAWRLLVPDAGREVEAFAARVHGLSSETLEELEAQSAAATVVGVEARWSDRGASVVVGRQGEGRRAPWVLLSGVLGLYPNDTPIAALHSFVDAYARGRTDVLLRLAPRRVRERLDGATVRARLDEPDIRMTLAPRLEALSGAFASASAQGDRLQVLREGGRARVVYGRYRAVLEREPDGWHVADL